jgi:hypothetical protein
LLSVGAGAIHSLPGLHYLAFVLGAIYLSSSSAVKHKLTTSGKKDILAVKGSLFDIIYKIEKHLLCTLFMVVFFILMLSLMAVNAALFKGMAFAFILCAFGMTLSDKKLSNNDNGFSGVAVVISIIWPVIEIFAMK